MANEIVKSVFGKEENALLLKGLESIKASLLRAKTKEANDHEMVEIYEQRLAKIEALRAKIVTKELF